MIEFKTFYKKVSISIFLNGNKGNIIFAPGLPQYVSKYHPFLLTLCNMGFNVFIIKYKGSFESGGSFSLKNSKKSIELAIDLVKNGGCYELYNNKKITWPSNEIYLLAFSYASLPALLQERKVKRTILVCPFVNPYLHLKGFGEDIEKTFAFVEKAYKNLYRFKKDNLIKEMINIRYPKNKENIFVVKGKYDTSINSKEIDFLIEKYNAKLFISDKGHTINLDPDLFKRILF